MEPRNTFLDTDYVTIPIEQFEDLLNTARDAQIIKRLIKANNYITFIDLCTILEMPIPPEFKKDDADNVQQ